MQSGLCTEVKLVVTGGGCGESNDSFSIDVLTDEQTVFCGANGLEARLTHNDTNTIDLEGLGTAGSPLEANVILTPDANVPNPNNIPNSTNLIKEGAPGIYVSCEDVQDCVGAAIDIMTADCLNYDDATNTISIAICGEPNGIECVPVGDAACPTGGLAVFPSSDANNSLTFGTDDRLFSPAVAILPGECMTFTGTGTVADPFVIQPLVAPEQNGVECVPGQGLLVTPSADPNNGLVFGGDTRLWINRCPLSIAGSQILIGNVGPCFEFTGGNDCVTPMLATLRFSDDVCNGAGCLADGLYVQVDQTELPAPVVLTQNLGPFGPFNGAIPDTIVVPETCLSLTNPSPCRVMSVQASLTGFAETGRTSGHMRFIYDVSQAGPGGPYFGVSQAGQRNPTPASRIISNATWIGVKLLIGSGGTITECFRILVGNAADPGQPIVNGRVFSGQIVFTLTPEWAQ